MRFSAVLQLILMKKFIFLTVLSILTGCSSEFNFDQTSEEDFTFDDEGDPVIENVDPENKSFGLDNSYCYGFSTPDANVAEIDIPDKFPPFHDLSDILPPIGSQGNQGSCVAWASGYYLKSFQENLEDFENGEIPFQNVMSPSFIFNQIKITDDCNSGSQIQSALELLLNSGIPQWNIMPYNQDECSIQPRDLQKALAKPNRIDSFFYLDGDILLEQTKAFLLNDQPVVIAISIDRSYFGAKDELGNHIYRKFKKVDGAHAMLVVGYDDAMNAFKVVNSWGLEWGNNGFVWIDYKAFYEAMDDTSDFKILCEAWVTNDLIN